MPDYKRRPAVATVADADENGEIIEGSEQYARSNVFSSPRKEKSNTSKSRTSSRRGESSSSSASPRAPTSNSSESSGNAHSSSRRASKSSKEKARSPTTKKPVVTIKRPAIPAHTKSMPAPPSNTDEVASYYGLPERTTVATTRPRAMTARPSSYYGQSIARPPTRPPLSSSAWYGQPPAQSPYQGPPMPPTSFPPPSWAPPQSPVGPPPPAEYFAPHHNLASRFQRPQSALGHRQSPSLEYPPEYANAERGLTRRPSQSRKHRSEAEDRAAMPPPPRPKTTRPSERISLRPGPPRVSSTRGFEDEDLYGDSGSYVPIEHRRSRDFSEPLAFRPRRSSITYDDGYDVPSAVEPASSSRRSSYYNVGGAAASSSYEDKLNLASSYQEHIGGPTAALTADALRRAQSGSSRSGTRSSYSRDERKSAATRTTRSSSGNEEDVTITVHGGAVLEIAGTKIKCDDGGEINISSGRGTSNRGSDRGTVYEDDRSDRRSRATRPPTRTRASSQSMYSRAPAIPPYPTYPHAPTHVGAYYDNGYF